MFARRGWWVLLLGVLLTGGVAQDPVELSAVPLLQSVTEGSILPVVVRVESRTGNLSGVLVVSTGGFSRRREYHYPLELPAGARKELVVTPYTSRFDNDLRIEFRAGRIRREVSVRFGMQFGSESWGQVLMVSDLVGGLQLLTRIPLRGTVPTANVEPGKYTVSYCKPEQVPPQGIALGQASLILLNDGAERMSQEQFTAVRHWVEMGGTLIVPGGAGATYLQHPQLRDLLPVQVRGLTQVERLEAIGTLLGRAAPQGRTILTEAVPKSHARVWVRQGNLPLIALAPYGLGTVIFLAFDPTEEPLRSYPALEAFWKTLLHSVVDRSPGYFMTLLHASQSNTAMNPWDSSNIGQDMRIELPSLSLVFGVLLIYFVLVVPVNYWILKRFRLLDWTWVSTLLIALVFTVIIGAAGRDLYRKPLSSKIQTTLLLQAGSPNAYGVSSGLFFFPRAGLYDIRFEQTEMVESGTVGGWFGGSVSPSSVMVTLEGEPRILKDYAVRNLSFEWFRYTRRVQLPGTIGAQLRIVKRSDGRYVEGFITNRLPYRLKNPRLVVGTYQYPLPTIEPRQTVRVRQALKFLDSRRGAFEAPSHGIVPHSGGRLSFDTQYPDPLSYAFQQAQEWQATPHDLLTAFLLAKADEPVLAPTLGQNVQSRAQNTYWVSIPLEVSP